LEEHTQANYYFKLFFSPVYFETDRQQNAGSIQFTIGTTNPVQTRTWKVIKQKVACVLETTLD